MPRRQEYEIPSFGASNDHLHGWLMESVEEAQAWLGTQRQTQTWEMAMELMNSPDPGNYLDNQSNTHYPKIKRMGRELVASLANFRHAGEFKVKWNNELYDTAHILTLLDKNWYNTTFAGDVHREGIQNAVFLGTNYWYEEWDKHFWGPDKGDIRLTAINPANVTFVQLPPNRDIQLAYMVIIRQELPINLAKRIYQDINPLFAASLTPDRDQPSGFFQKGLQKVQQFLSPALRVAGRSRQGDAPISPTVDIYTAYTMDNAINERFEPIQMGPPGANWSYDVPFVGMEVPTGIANPATGDQFTRKAKPSECRLFPLRRMTVFSNTGVATDGSSPWWHGDVPLARSWYNDLPQNALGSSTITDAASMEASIGALMRNIDDSAAARLDPPALYDDSAVSSTFAKNFNPRAAGARASAPLLSAGVPLQYPFPPQYYDVPNWITDYIKSQEDRMEYVTAVRDIVAIAKAKQVPGADTLEKLLEMAGPIVQDMVAANVKPLTQLGTWRASYYFQFYNSARMIDTVGPDDGTLDILRNAYMPERLKPYIQHKALKYSPELLLPVREYEGGAAYRERQQRMVGEFVYEVTESGLNEIHRMTSKLFYLQLMKEGFPISWWTFAQIARIPNFGPPPEGTNNELERWVAQQRMMIELKTKLAEEANAAAMASGMPPAGAPEGGEGGENMSGGEAAPGRPNSYNAPPRLVQKDGGTRSTVTTSR